MFKVSVRLMTYNHADYIEKALLGIFSQQTDFKTEIVVGDDFSSDNTLAKIKEFSSNENFTIKLLNREKGDEYWVSRKEKGRLYNFQNILENCRGEYIALLDGDDYWTDSLKLKKQVDFMDHNKGYQACFTNAQLVDEKDNLIGIYQNYSQKVFDIYRIILGSGSLFPTASLLFRNNIKEIPDFFVKAKAGDRALALILATKGDFYLMDEIMCAYRKHSEGIFTSIINNKHKRREIDLNNINLMQNFNSYTNQVYSKTINKAISKRALISLLREEKPLVESLKNNSISKFLTFSDFMRLIKNNFVPKKGEEVNEA